LCFASPTSPFISRTTKIDKGGLTAELSPENQHGKTQTGSEAVQQLLGAVGSPIVINETEKTIRNDLTVRGLSIEGDTTKVPIKYLAGTQLFLAFGKIHSSIFGS
jgi:hypothetical protein